MSHCQRDQGYIVTQNQLKVCACVCVVKDFIYLFIFREGEREGEKHQCVIASHMSPHQGPSLQPRHVPSIGEWNQ